MKLLIAKIMKKILMNSIRSASNGKYFFNFAGSAEPVQFSADNEYSISGSGNGISMQKSGVGWFGNNTISSKKYTLYVDSVEVASMKIEKYRLNWLNRFREFELKQCNCFTLRSRKL